MLIAKNESRNIIPITGMLHVLIQIFRVDFLAAKYFGVLINLHLNNLANQWSPFVRVHFYKPIRFEVQIFPQFFFIITCSVRSNIPFSVKVELESLNFFIFVL